MATIAKKAENAEETILIIQFSCFGFFVKINKAGAKIKTIPTIPLSVNSGIVKFEVVKKFVISLFQYLLSTTPDKTTKLKYPIFRCESVKKTIKIAINIIVIIINIILYFSIFKTMTF